MRTYRSLPVGTLWYNEIRCVHHTKRIVYPFSVYGPSKSQNMWNNKTKSLEFFNVHLFCMLTATALMRLYIYAVLSQLQVFRDVVSTLFALNASGKLGRCFSEMYVFHLCVNYYNTCNIRTWIFQHIAYQVTGMSLISLLFTSLFTCMSYLAPVSHSSYKCNVLHLKMQLSSADKPLYFP